MYNTCSLFHLKNNEHNLCRAADTFDLPCVGPFGDVAGADSIDPCENTTFLDVFDPLGQQASYS